MNPIHAMYPNVPSAAAAVRRAVVLVDHGSRRAEANALLDAVAARVRPLLDGAAVIAAHMELAPPSLPEAIVQAAAAGAGEVVVVPFFLSPGRHTIEDLPRLCAEGAAAAGGVCWRLTPALGDDELILEIIRRRVAGSLGLVGGRVGGGR